MSTAPMLEPFRNGVTEIIRDKRDAVKNYVPIPIQYIEVAPGRTVAYRKFSGPRKPTILYVPGWLSTMELSKIVVLEQYARQNGYSNVRYDQETCGYSKGDRMKVEFEHWVEDALCMIDRVCEGPIILCASSVGSWIATIVAQMRPERIHSMVLIGPGFNLLWSAFWYYYSLLPPEKQEAVDKGENSIPVKMRYGGINYLRKDFCEKSRKFEIDFEKPINIHCPVRIVHAIHDKDVPYESTLNFVQGLTTKDVDLILRKTGDHRLNSSSDCTLQLFEIDRLIKQYPVDESESISTPTSASTSVSLASKL